MVEIKFVNNFQFSFRLFKGLGFMIHVLKMVDQAWIVIIWL
jgi:hypothetical protein